MCIVVRGAKDKHSLVQWTCIYTAIAFLAKKLDPTSSVSGSYGRQASRQTKDFKIFKILYRLNYLEFYFVDQCNVINTVRSAFQSAFLKQSVF